MKGTNTMLQMLSHDPLQQLLKNNFNKDIDDIIKQLDISEKQYIQQQNKWSEFLTQIKKSFIYNENLTPIQLVQYVKKICQYEQLIDEKSISLCNKLKKWQLDEQSLVNIIEQLSIIQEIPENGISNVDIDQIMDLFEKSFKNFKRYKITTSDFAYCDVQKRFIQDDYPSEQLVQQISKNINKVNENGDFVQYQKNLDPHEFGKLNKQKFQNLLNKGYTKLGVISNTDRCHTPGKHWVAIFIDLDQGSLELFNSTDDYYTQTKLILNYLNFLKQELKQLKPNTTIKVIAHQGDYQISDNSCGVYSILYLFCRLIQIEPQQFAQVIKNDKSEHFLNIFKTVIFG